MAEEKINTWITGILIGAVTALYGFFIRHVVGHPDRGETNEQIRQHRAEMNEEVQQLWNKKQSVERCDEIVKRLDENHKETCKKLDRLLKLAESRAT